MLSKCQQNFVILQRDKEGSLPPPPPLREGRIEREMEGEKEEISEKQKNIINFKRYH